MKKIVLALTLATLLTTSTSEATRIDRYRAMVENNSFTIRYEIDKPPTRETNKEGTLTKSGNVANSSMKASTIALFQTQPHSGVVVVDGENRYIEQHRDFVKEFVGTPMLYGPVAGIAVDRANTMENIKVREIGVCQLLKDGEIFKFQFRVNKDNEKKYSNGGASGWFGSSKDVKAIDAESVAGNTYTALIEGMNFGSAALSKSLLPILPPARVIQTAFTPNYKYFDAGTLDDGTNYEDYISNENGVFHAIRYYFDGDELKSAKIVAYAANLDGQTGYEKTIIRFTEFSATPDQSLLQLPEGLRDKTKRDEKSVEEESE